MFLPPILLGLDQIHLAFGHHVVDGPQIADVLFLHKPRFDRRLTFLHIIRNIVIVWHGFAVPDPGPVQMQDSPLRLDSIRRQERLDRLVQMDRRGG